jgi:hypothetical protein
VSAPPVQTSSSVATAERFVGRAMRRTEDLRFVTGRGCYVDDGIVATGAAAAIIVRDLPLSAANIARWIRDAQCPG